MAAPAVAFERTEEVAALISGSANRPLSSPLLYYWIAGVLVLIAPSSGPRLLCFCLLGLVHYVALMPRVPNHGYLIIAAYVAIILGLVRSWRQPRGPDAQSVEAFAALAPPVRWTLLVLYFWAFVHKLCWDFLDPATSCATMQLSNLEAHLRFLPIHDWMIYPAIYGTLAVEGGIPLLLLFDRTRLSGIALAFVFHLFLGSSYPGFSTFLFALLALFVPPHALAALADRVSRLRAQLQRGIPRFARSTGTWEGLCFVATYVGVRTLAWTSRAPTNVPYFVYGLGLFAITAYALTSAPVEPVDGRRMLALPEKSACILPILVFILGSLPHLGIKNTQSFAMYSNLRTELGKTNHLFIPASLQVAGFLNDPVEIVDSNDPFLKSHTHPVHAIEWNSTFVLLPKTPLGAGGMKDMAWKFFLPFFMLESRVTELRSRGARGVYVKYRRQGKLYETANAEDDPELSEAPYWLRKFLFLRSIPDTPVGLCMW